MRYGLKGRQRCQSVGRDLGRGKAEWASSREAPGRGRARSLRSFLGAALQALGACPEVPSSGARGLHPQTAHPRKGQRAAPTAPALKPASPQPCPWDSHLGWLLLRGWGEMVCRERFVLLQVFREHVLGGGGGALLLSGNICGARDLSGKKQKQIPVSQQAQAVSTAASPRVTTAPPPWPSPSPSFSPCPSLSLWVSHISGAPSAHLVATLP